MMDGPMLFGAAALAISLVGFALGTIISDHFATKYWEKEISRIKKMHKSELASETIASFNRGVLAALSENDKDIPND